MNRIETKGVICVRENNVEYKICNINYILYENEEYKYEFIPKYNVIDLLEDFQGIPGLNLDLKKDKYIRENTIPIFISERAPNKNREDLWVLLEEVNLDYHNQLEWLIRTKTQYSGDNLYVCKDIEVNTSYENFDILGNNSSNIIKNILNLVCGGLTFRIKNLIIDDSNRKFVYDLLFPLYLKNYNYVNKKQSEGRRGRNSISNDILYEYSIFELYFKSKLSLEEALLKLNISQATFYRNYKKFKEKY